MHVRNEKQNDLRIVSLIASSTEIVCALGLESNLVGRSHECDYPPSVRALPSCTEPKFRVDTPSGEIDRQVKTILQQALSIYRVDADQLKELHPTHILTQTQCEVCAVSLKDVEAALAEWLPGSGTDRPRVVALQPDSLADVWSDMLRVAEALGVADRGARLVSDLQARMASIEQRAAALSRPTVGCIEWIEPLMASGNWMPDLVAMAGGCNLFGEAGRHAPWLEWEHVVAEDPDVILILPCGFDIARTRKEFPALLNRPEWPQLTAVLEGKVYLLDGNQYFNRPGPRLAESLEILAEIIHPGSFHFGHKGLGWQPALATFKIA